MNIVIINGSTRKGNTLTTIDAFIKGASEKLDDPDATALQISNMVRDAIKPDITMFLHYETLEENGKKIVAVDIQRGTDRPYYIAKKGMRPEGVYARQGYLAVPATDAAIRQMIKETDGDRFEAMRSMNQELTFETTEKEFQLRKVEFGMQQMRTLKVIDQDGLYSNLAMLLSDQCVHTIKVAVFQGKDQTVFKDRREFAGALMKQMNDVYDYIDFHNQTHATIEKLLRIFFFRFWLRYPYFFTHCIDIRQNNFKCISCRLNNRFFLLISISSYNLTDSSTIRFN